MDRTATINVIVEHYDIDSKGRIDYDPRFGVYLETLTDTALTQVLAWYERRRSRRVRHQLPQHPKFNNHVSRQKHHQGEHEGFAVHGACPGN